MNHNSNSGGGLGLAHEIGAVLMRGGREVSRRMTRAMHALAGRRVGGLAFSGEFHVRNIAADGHVRWEQKFSNGVTNEGLDRILNTMFDGKTQIGAGAWYIGLISSVSYSALAAGDTYASHAGWTECGTTNAPDYTGNRKAWDPAASTAQSSSNAATVDFAMLASGTVKGLGLFSVETKDNQTSGADNVLWATGLFPGGDQAVVNGDTLKITYTVNASAA